MKEYLNNLNEKKIFNLKKSFFYIKLISYFMNNIKNNI